MVRVNATPVPLLAVTPTQINFQVPWELSGQTQASLQVTTSAGTSSSFTFRLTGFSPAIFTATDTRFDIFPSSSRQGFILTATGQLAGPANPARPGDFVQIFCAGLGAVNNPPATGATASTTPLSTTISVPRVTIGGVSATVSFSGLAPGFVGLYQVNVQVPSRVGHDAGFLDGQRLDH